MTNHTYFNLSGFGRTNILEHELKINAELEESMDSVLKVESFGNELIKELNVDKEVA